MAFLTGVLVPDPGPRELRRQSTRQLTDLLTRPVGMGETTRDTGDAHRGLRRVGETRRNAVDGGDARRMAHNPEVEGSLPPLLPKAGGPFSNRERALLHEVREIDSAHGAVRALDSQGF